MLHCPLSFNHVFHRNLFPLSQRGELREKRCGLLPNRGKLYFLQRGSREEERMNGFPTTKETRNAVREKERKKRGKMARDTGGIIVTSKTRDTPLLPPPQFSSKRTRRKVSSLVSVAHALEIVADPAKKKTLELHPQRSIRSQLPTSANSTFFEPRVRTISFQDLHPRGSHEGNSPRWRARSVQGNSVHIRGDEWSREVEPVTRGGGGRRSRGVGLPRFSGTASADFQVGRVLPYHCR